jgi:hypothetical protein
MVNKRTEEDESKSRDCGNSKENFLRVMISNFRDPGMREGLS